jgi:pyruvate ferredoxin oxidoreductase alpha subunit
MGAWVMPEYYMEFKVQQEEAMRRADDVIREVNDTYKGLFGRGYGNGLVDVYRTEDADVILVTLGSMTGVARVVVDEFRSRGEPVGLLRIRTLRPFPKEDLKKAVAGSRLVAVVSRDVSLGGGFGGAILSEVRSALYELDEKPHVVGFVVGLGGRDITTREFSIIVEKSMRVAKIDEVKEDFEFIGVKG